MCLLKYTAGEFFIYHYNTVQKLTIALLVRLAEGIRKAEGVTCVDVDAVEFRVLLRAEVLSENTVTYQPKLKG